MGLAVTKKKKILDEPTAKMLFQQIVNAVSYVHAKEIIHNDLKPSNFVFHGCGTDNLEIV